MSTDEGREPSARWELGAFCLETIETLPAVLNQVLSHAPHPSSWETEAGGPDSTHPWL